MTDTDVLDVFGLQPQFPAHSSQPPGNFLTDENGNSVSCSVNEVTRTPPTEGAGGQWSLPGG